jgi:hypothetical protein
MNWYAMKGNGGNPPAIAVARLDFGSVTLNQPKSLTVAIANSGGELSRGPVDEDEAIREVTDRSYWEGRGTPATLAVLDGIFEMVHGRDPALELKYNKFCVGLAKDGQPHNFVISRPQKNALMLTIRLQQSPECRPAWKRAASRPSTTTNAKAGTDCGLGSMI